MTIWGWLIMVVSVTSVTTLFAWCVWQVLSAPGESEKVHGFEVETPDESAGRKKP